uniref:Uncharacterized protein n=1 Tax=Siphoviridae sp. ctNHp14 TaxID=2827857 RepID=A0A8S5SM85_9CAUD|nr:MAG TPA: hypothetical protein [Siphoviridae sp. ctNHp14]DAK54413.1 MAG TPA: hypothetical protein [Caudoviricetes sp.]
MERDILFSHGLNSFNFSLKSSSLRVFVCNETR